MVEFVKGPECIRKSLLQNVFRVPGVVDDAQAGIVHGF